MSRNMHKTGIIVKKEEGNLMNNRGLTLVEILIVVAIIGILAAVAIPGYIGQQKNAARSEASTNLQNLRLLMEQNFADQGSYAPTAYCRTGVAAVPALELTYNGTAATNNASIEDYFCRFNPAGLDNTSQFTNLNYTYTLTLSATVNATGFTATATGKAGRRTAGDVCTIDQNNSRTGPCW